MDYFKIKNWEKYQDKKLHSCVGGAPYVRLYTNILDDPKICSLTSEQRLTWVLLMALSGRVGVLLRFDSGWVKARLGLKKVPDLALFESLGLIERVLREEKRRKDKNIQEAMPPTGVNSFLSHWGGDHELLNWLIEKWNSNLILTARQKAVIPVGNQRTKILEVLKHRPDKEYWTKVLDAFSQSKWLLENTKKGLNWLIVSGKADEILNGSYGAKEQKKKPLFVDHVD